MPNAGNYELERWIKAMTQGDRDALARFYRATSSDVYAYALSIVKNPYDAQDVMHDSYVSIWSSAERYTPQGKPMAWIMTVVKNQALGVLRRQKRYVSQDDTPVRSQASDPETSAILRLCMERLTDQERQIVVLHAVVGMKHRHIAELLGIPQSTVLSKYRRSLQKLREQL